MVAAVGFISWIFAVLVPEYCLQAMADSSSMGAGLIGLLFVLIALMPVVFLGPFVISYWLQFLGRVLVSSAMGECAPPRMPDRNFDGFLNGLSPWFLWIILGLGLGLIPAVSLGGATGAAGGSAWLLLALATVALPYILAALMLSFLHDDALAAMPWGVLLGLVRLGPAFLMLCGLIGATLGFAGGCVALALELRSARVLALPARRAALLHDPALDPDGRHAAAGRVLLPPQGRAPVAEGGSALGGQVETVRDPPSWRTIGLTASASPAIPRRAPSMACPSASGRRSPRSALPAGGR